MADPADVLHYFPAISFTEALAKICCDLKMNPNHSDHWRSLHFLLLNSNEDCLSDPTVVLNLCLEYFENPVTSDADVRLISEVLVLLIEKHCSEELKPELSKFLKTIQFTITTQMKTNLQTEVASHGLSKSASIIFSRILPSALTANLLEDSKSIEEVVLSMIHSKSEKAIVEALVYMFPALSDNPSSLDVVFRNIRQLFEDDNEKYSAANHPGLTALCSIADILFLKNPSLIRDNEEWFCKSVQREISNSVALNRKRSQYLLKRYADFFPEKASLFNEFFLIVEALEEKQAHIITPVLTKVKGLEKRILEEKQANPSWICCIYARTLSHENLQIVKWGLVSLFEVKLDLWTGLGADDWLHEKVLTGLNNVSFYLREKSTDLPKMAESFIDFMQKCSKLLTERAGFFKEMIRASAQVSWNSVGLFHVSYAMASISPAEKFLEGPIMQTTLEFLRGGLHTQYPILRGAIAGLLMEFVLNVSVVSEENLMWITLMLSTLNEKECYVPGSRVRNTLKTWFSEHFTHSQLKEYLAKLFTQHFQGKNEGKSIYSVDATSLARFIVLLEDSALLDDEAIQLVQQSLSPLENCHLRLYADQQSIYSRLKLLVGLINESRCNVTVPASLVKAIGLFTESATLFCLDRIELLVDYPDLCETLFILESITAIPEFVTPSTAERVASVALKLIEMPQALSKSKSVALLLIADHLDRRITEPIVREILERKMHCQSLEHCDVNNVTWGAFMSDYFAKLWKLIHRKLNGIIQTWNVEQLVEESVGAMDMVGVEAVKSIFSCLHQLLPAIEKLNPSLCTSTLKILWSTCFEYRRSEHFWPLIEAFSRTVFQASLMENQNIGPLVFDYISEMKKQGENTLMLFNLPAERVIDQWINHSFPAIDEFTVNFLADVLTFGQVHRRDEMILYETCTFVELAKEKFSVNPELRSENLADGQVRFQGLRFLLFLNKDNEQHVKMAESLLEGLLSQDRILLKQKKRYFANSNGHRLKHRLWLAVLILQDLLPVDCDVRNGIFSQALTGLIDDNPQPSVRFLQEWTVMRLIYRVPKLEEEFWRLMDDAVAQRIGSMVSFLSIVGHSTACLAGSERLENFASNAIPRALPWAMAQHFTPRLYGSVVLDMIWRICEKAGLEELLLKYDLVRQIQRRAPEMPNAQRNLEKLSQDFYMCLFHPLESFTLETLCYHLPRLSNLTNEEWLPVNWFDSIDSWLPKRDRDNRLAECQPADWVTRAAGGAPALVASEESTDAAGVVDNVQKKITPWKQMFPDLETLTLTAGRKKSSTNDLIVIASLIDRIPNLGGLCRTCEVLGVKDFVISSLRITEEKDFVSLSVSAERWMNMFEVKPHQLLDYIKDLKLSGYTVVGAEQTAGSRPLNHFNFPKKTALLLGHEKEGIPVELIQHLDVCVEVPQEGIIRSMNVHVTGAIFIWEYVRQQLGL